ncbi:MAG TPA: hypothetical protein VHE78_16620 [Gemmatimonadaceae bacterium]|nr:hypothetical protein [Gemmatimonadaceae bacterium]
MAQSFVDRVDDRWWGARGSRARHIGNPGGDVLIRRIDENQRRDVFRVEAIEHTDVKSANRVAHEYIRSRDAGYTKQRMEVVCD